MTAILRNVPLLRSLPLLLAVALIGCGESGPELGEVEGVVKLDGKPLPNAVVTFAPAGGGPSGIGKTDAEGKYQLMTGSESGAVVGDHKVSIIAVPEPAPVDPNAGHGEGAGIDTSSQNYKPPAVPTVPARYNAETELTEKVESGSNTIDFDLKS